VSCQAGTDDRVAAIGDPGFRHHDDIRISHRFLVQSERFPDKALYAIP
jgi:hypothetical protein